MKVLELETVVDKEECEVRLYRKFTLPMALLQGWFNDQHDCFQLLISHLQPDELRFLFTDQRHFESVKATYRELWYGGHFKKVAVERRGEHRRLNHLVFSSRKRRGYSYWAKCVFNAVDEAGSIESLMGRIGTVEAAHCRFIPWFYKRRDLTRGLNAADAARILARYGYLKPESRPLLARGALRGAAILLDRQPRSMSIEVLEGEYDEESKRVSLEERAAEYIAASKDFHGDFQMEDGENWFCSLHKEFRS